MDLKLDVYISGMIKQLADRKFLVIIRIQIEALKVSRLHAAKAEIVARLS